MYQLADIGQMLLRHGSDEECALGMSGENMLILG
jgi:hypothetical protein